MRFPSRVCCFLLLLRLRRLFRLSRIPACNGLRRFNRLTTKWIAKQARLFLTSSVAGDAAGSLPLPAVRPNGDHELRFAGAAPPEVPAAATRASLPVASYPHPTSTAPPTALPIPQQIRRQTRQLSHEPPGLIIFLAAPRQHSPHAVAKTAGRSRQQQRSPTAGKTESQPKTS
ncbi:MAG UNVERIFIED_CONTAM: hypothetical protein LVR18_52525 [Planctomycetaceae bacterium]